MVSQYGNQAYGTVLVVSASLIFALVAFIVKKDPLPRTMAVETRFLVGWLMSLAFMTRYRSERGLNFFGPAKIRWVLLLRGLLSYSFVKLWWVALLMAPLGDCTAVVYCSPFLTVLWSRLLLGEKELAIFPIQALIATTGMCFIVQPPLLSRALDLAPADASSGGNYTFAILATVVASIMPVVTLNTKDASWIEVEHVTNFLAVFVLNPIFFCAQQFAKGETVLVPPAVSVWEVAFIVVAALASSAGVALQTRGYQMADPGKASMFTYVEIIFSYSLQVLGTHSPITTNSMIGAILVLLACLLGAAAQSRSSKSQDTALEAPLVKEADGFTSDEVRGA